VRPQLEYGICTFRTTTIAVLAGSILCTIYQLSNVMRRPASERIDRVGLFKFFDNPLSKR
jgi:hypothetical protein